MLIPCLVALQSPRAITAIYSSLEEAYPILYIDAIRYSVRDNGVIRKLAAYIILGINAEGKKKAFEGYKYPQCTRPPPVH